MTVNPPPLPLPKVERTIGRLGDYAAFVATRSCTDLTYDADVVEAVRFLVSLQPALRHDPLEEVVHPSLLAPPAVTPRPAPGAITRVKFN